MLCLRGWVGRRCEAREPIHTARRSDAHGTDVDAVPAAAGRRGGTMIERRPFGRTGHHSSVTLFGAAALARASQAEADLALEVLLRYGVNHIDTAARYGDSELRIGPWMARHRKDFFLATKTGQRTAPEARADIHRSLERLRVDHVDLIQLHSLGHPDDWDRALGPGGALEAAVEAREQGLTRFIGVTGHGWTIAVMHRRSLGRFDFDSVLLPYNYFMAQDERYQQSFEELLGICRARNVAVQIIKSIARGPWATTDRTRTTWYQPLEEQPDIDRAVHWTLDVPGVFLNTPGDLTLLPRVLAAACGFARGPADSEMGTMLASTRMTSLFGLST
jgi:aryl-alcohol dehydrogenase-like predicted oxidoreductase